MERSGEVDNGKEDCKQAQASKLILASWSRKESLGSGNPKAQRSGANGKVPSEELEGKKEKKERKGIGVWQNLLRKKKKGGEDRVWQTQREEKEEGLGVWQTL